MKCSHHNLEGKGDGVVDVLVNEKNISIYRHFATKAANHVWKRNLSVKEMLKFTGKVHSMKAECMTDDAPAAMLSDGPQGKGKNIAKPTRIWRVIKQSILVVIDL